MVEFEIIVNRIHEIQINDASPEKAGVGGSIPSLATIFSNPVPSQAALYYLREAHSYCSRPLRKAGVGGLRRALATTFQST